MNKKIHPTIMTLGFSEAGMFLQSSDGSQVEALISIHGTHEHGIDGAFRFRLDLNFDDTAAPDPADRVAVHQALVQRRWHEENGLKQKPPTVEDARAIVQFAGVISKIDGIVLCHCSGGVSRSCAAALLCLAEWTGSGEEHYCVQELLRVRPCAMPHYDIVRMGDEVLKREGRLVEAVRKLSAGNDD